MPEHIARGSRPTLHYIVALSLLVLSAFSTHAQQASDYDAAIVRFQTFYNHQQPDSIFDLFSDHMKTLMPADKVGVTFRSMYTKAGRLKNNTLIKQQDGFNFYKSEFANKAYTFIVQLDKDKKLNVFRFGPYIADTLRSNYNITMSTGTLYGSLTMPEVKGQVPVVLLIAGSGPTDRDCNNLIIGKTNAYLMLADSLQKAGIACVRFDKRGVGESSAALTNQSDETFDDIVNDAAAYLEKMSADKRFSKVFILGHSEGSLIGMILAERDKPAGYISLAGAGQPADKVLEKQYLAQSLDLAQKATEKFDSLKKGYTVKEIPPPLISIFMEPLQPYIRSWIKYDPAAEIKKVKCPVLVLQGSNDIQVGADQAKLLADASGHATLKIIPGMSHVLKPGPEDRTKNFATYSKADLPLCPELSDAVIQFVKAN